MLKTKNIVIVIVLLVVAIVSYKVGFNNGKGGSESVDVPVVENSTINEETGPPMVFDGTGGKWIGPVDLHEGLSLIHAKNQSGANSAFTVNLYYDKNRNGEIDSGEGWTGTTIGVGYEEAEAYDGTLAFKANGYQYMAYVEGGRWQVSFEQPEKLNNQPQAPFSFSGTNSTVTDKFYLSAGDYDFHVTNDGGGNFIIYLVDEDGNSTDRLVNQVGGYEGDFTVNAVFDGNYVFAVEGGNNWTVGLIE